MGAAGPAVRVGALGLIFALALALSALAQAFPALTGRVVDSAGMLDAASIAAIEARLAAHEQKSSDQLVVATVPDLGGQAIEPFANALFRHWALGQAGEDNGVLFLVARDDRKIRIEVGYGLEGVLTDLYAKLIIENTVTPAFRAGDFAGGIARGVDDILLVLAGDGAELEARARRNLVDDNAIPVEMMVFIAIWVSIFGFAIAFAVLPPMFGRKIGPGRYRWLGMDFEYSTTGGSSRKTWSSGSSGWSSGGGGWSSGGGGFSGGGGSSGGGGASGGW